MVSNFRVRKRDNMYALISVAAQKSSFTSPLFVKYAPHTYVFGIDDVGVYI